MTSAGLRLGKTGVGSHGRRVSTNREWSKDHYFLPGGGSLPEETPEETVRREVKEELAREICIVGQIGRAIQYFHAEGQDYRMEAVFFAGKLGDEVVGTGEHELCWLQVGQIEEGFYHESHAWAIREQIGRTREVKLDRRTTFPQSARST